MPSLIAYVNITVRDNLQIQSRTANNYDDKITWGKEFIKASSLLRLSGSNLNLDESNWGLTIYDGGEDLNLLSFI